MTHLSGVIKEALDLDAHNAVITLSAYQKKEELKKEKKNYKEVRRFVFISRGGGGWEEIQAGVQVLQERLQRSKRMKEGLVRETNCGP